MDNKQRIKTPEEISELMEELWLSHKAGISCPRNNVFWVDFPPPTKEELEEEVKEMQREEEDDEDGQFGAFI